MRFLILTQYFPPETGAPQNRLLQLAKRLQKLGVEVTVLTAMPNYPQMRIYEHYRKKTYCFEIIEGIPVHRCWIYAGTSKAILPRLINYFSFVITSFLAGLFKSGRQDYIMCESPPLFLGMSAWLLAKIKGAGMIFNVSDLWPESAEKLGLVTNRHLLNMSTRLEEFLYRHSVMVTGQTMGIVNNIASRFPDKCIFWLKNGVDLEELSSIPADASWRASNGFSADDFLLLYAGILGHAQGLEVIIKAASLLQDKPEIKFLLAGSGPLREELISLKNKLNLRNVFFLENRPKREVVPIIHAADIALIPLRKLDLFKGAIPSKIFENLALHKPILLGVEGEALDLFIRQGGAGWSFEPENAEDLALKVRYLSENRHLLKEAGNQAYDYLCREFNLDVVASEFHSLIIEKGSKPKKL